MRRSQHAPMPEEESVPRQEYAVRDPKSRGEASLRESASCGPPPIHRYTDRHLCCLRSKETYNSIFRGSSRNVVIMAKISICCGRRRYHFGKIAHMPWILFKIVARVILTPKPLPNSSDVGRGLQVKGWPELESYGIAEAYRERALVLS